MSRVSDLIDLIQNVNDFYLINPLRNGRSVYIQVDDLCELAMKSWLQVQATTRQERFLRAVLSANLIKKGQREELDHYYNGVIDEATLEARLGITVAQQTNWRTHLTAHQPLENWSANVGNGFKKFQTVIDEVKTAKPDSNPANVPLHDTLDRISDRRANRNKFFHDQNQTGLTVDDESCLYALTDLYGLCGFLFGSDYHKRVEAKAVVRAQVVVIKLKWHGTQTGAVLNHYSDILRLRGTIQLAYTAAAHEFCTLNEDARNFYQRIKQHFDNEIIARYNEVHRIESLKNKTQSHVAKMNILRAEIAMFEEVLKECF